MKPIPPSAFQLTVEQQLQMRIFKDQVESASAEDLRLLLLDLVRQNYVTRNIVKQGLKLDLDRLTPPHDEPEPS